MADSVPGPSRPLSRGWSPDNLSSDILCAGSRQLPSTQYPYSYDTTTPTAMEAANEYYESTSLVGSLWETQSAGPPSEPQLYRGTYSGTIQPDLQMDGSYRGAPTAFWSSSASYDPSQWSSISDESIPAEQNTVPTAASSSNRIQPVLNPSPPSTATPMKACQLTASTSRFRLRKDPHSFSTAYELDMQGKMGRWRVAPPSPVLGEKRKRRASPTPLPDATSHAGSSAIKKARARTAAAEKSAKHRETTNRAMAELAALLPRHLQLYESKPSVRYVKQAIIYIEELNDHIRRLKDEAAALTAALESYSDDNRQVRSERDGLLLQRHALQERIGKLLHDSDPQQSHVEKDKKIGELEREPEIWQCTPP